MLHPVPMPSTSAAIAGAPARPVGLRQVPWGWLEWFLVAQTFIPALLFLPGINAIRTPIRMASFLIALVAWWSIFQSGRARPGADTFPSNFWLKLAAGWLLLLVIYWDTNSIQAGIAHALLYISVFSPAFWAPAALVTPRQIGRMMMILLACNGLSALVGLGQVFRPGTFNPPVIPALLNTHANNLSAQVVTYEDDHGNKITRPCGLTDQVGAAAGAGATAAMIGLAFALRPIGLAKRGACLALAFAGVAVIYYSQVRMIMIMLVICLMVLVALFAMQKNFAHATMLGGLGAAMIVGALAWVTATSGKSVTGRFTDLLETNLVEKYDKSRGGFVREALTETVWDYPIGAGLGWWGQIYGAFGDKTVPSKIWVEVMWPAWVIDGGIPLLLTYLAALGFAMTDTLRIALRTRDRELGFWAAVIFASNLSVLATCFSFVTFLTSIGIQFWLLAAALHAADLRVRSATNPALGSGPSAVPIPPPIA